MKFLIVNADDFGLSEGVNRGIIESFEQGIVTSASLMVRQPGAASAADYARKEPRLGIGLHVDLGEWVLDAGQWVQLYTVVPAEDRAAVAAEVERQIQAFRRLTGRNPTHIDSHQHVHREDPARSPVLAAGRRLGVPVREFGGVRYCGGFYGQNAEGQSVPQWLSVENLKKILATLPAGVTELGCHPGYNQGLASPYAAERELEVRTLCAPEIRQFLDEFEIQLRSFETVLPVLG